MNSPLDRQEGGDHYRKGQIQPVEFIHDQGLDFLEGNVVKYVTRHRHKGGLEDLKKARHYLEILISLKYPEEETDEEETEQQRDNGRPWWRSIPPG